MPLGMNLAGFWARQGMASKGALTGAALGGIYGMFADDTSVLGGALGGAMLGAGIGHFGVPAFRAGAKAWSRSAGSKALIPRIQRLGSAMGGSLYAQGRLAERQIGSTIMRGYNTFSALGRGIRAGMR